jgi:hypothetical protein
VPSSSTPRKNNIIVTLKKTASGYDATTSTIDIIGEKVGKPISWKINNPTIDEVDVAVRNFSPASPCPVVGPDFPSCAATARIRSGNSATFKAKISAAAVPGTNYKYELYVANAQTGVGNAIDPELQIDGKRGATYFAVVVGVIAVAAFVLYLLFR